MTLPAKISLALFALCILIGFSLDNLVGKMTKYEQGVKDYTQACNKLGGVAQGASYPSRQCIKNGAPIEVK